MKKIRKNPGKTPGNLKKCLKIEKAIPAGKRYRKGDLRKIQARRPIPRHLSAREILSVHEGDIHPRGGRIAQWRNRTRPGKRGEIYRTAYTDAIIGGNPPSIKEKKNKKIKLV